MRKSFRLPFGRLQGSLKGGRGFQAACAVPDSPFAPAPALQAWRRTAWSGIGLQNRIALRRRFWGKPVSQAGCRHPLSFAPLDNGQPCDLGKPVGGLHGGLRIVLAADEFVGAACRADQPEPVAVRQDADEVADGSGFPDLRMQEKIKRIPFKAVVVGVVAAAAGALGVMPDDRQNTACNGQQHECGLQIACAGKQDEQYAGGSGGEPEPARKAGNLQGMPFGIGITRRNGGRQAGLPVVRALRALFAPQGAGSQAA